MGPRQVSLVDDPQWYKDAVIYQVHVKGYQDLDSNGIGDFQGLLQRLDYLQELGITAIWLLPFYPSPLRDDGYDIADYYNVHPDYGSLKDFQEFLKSAHYRGIRVITELVLNHTSDQHRWFQLSRRARPGSPLRDFYVWSETVHKYQEARIIFKDFETSNWTYDQLAGAYYWHRFYSHQPDLNFDNPRVHKALLKVIDFWLGMGVDGLRLDAVPYLYEREGTNCENLPETHEFLKKLRRHVEEHYSNRLLLAEANQWPEDAAAYFGEADECHMAFHFPIMPRLYMALWMEDRFPIVDILEQTPEIPENCQWAIFLRNHDELTLEMVTDEERDYMYRVYARDPRARINLGIRRRLAPLVNNNRRKIELLNFLLFSLPGTPIIYYGDEIGMGDNYFLGDRNGVRTPMQWSPDRNAGFSRANPQHLYLPVILDPEYHFEVVNVENQDKNLSSLLWWMRRLVAMRGRFQAFGRGEIRFLLPDNPKVLAFYREYQEETILVVINLSRFAQVASLQLTDYSGFVPVEVFSGNRFPAISSNDYVFTLGSHDCFWFLLQKEKSSLSQEKETELPWMRPSLGWEEVLSRPLSRELERKILPGFLQRSRWFRSKARRIRNVQLQDDLLLPAKDRSMHLVLLEVFFSEGPSETYVLPLGFLEQEMDQEPEFVLARIQLPSSQGQLVDAVCLPEFRAALLQCIASGQEIPGEKGQLRGRQGSRLSGKGPLQTESLESRVLRGEQSNTSIIYSQEYFLKLYRKLEEGLNPDTELTIQLTDKGNFSYAPPFMAQLEYRLPGLQSMSMALLQGFVPSQGDAWSFVLDHLDQFLDQVQVTQADAGQIKLLPSFYQVHPDSVPGKLLEHMGGYFPQMISHLGEITARMHLSLGDRHNPDFAPEPFSKLYQRSLYQSLRSLTRRTLHSLNRSRNKLSQDVQLDADWLLQKEQELLRAFFRITMQSITSQKIRVHGDYHLGQVLYTGSSFCIVDFEGEPARSLGERRLKRSCLKDVAGMIRSFHYAAHTALAKQLTVRPTDEASLLAWTEPWFQYVSGIFLHSYLQSMQGSGLVPEKQQELGLLLDTFLLEKAVYELGYELNNRPDWMGIPLAGIKSILARQGI
ncbi:MAG: maltose alpha-D-glucosyltransferase [Thermodesulfobacteriota bacterium]